MADAHAHFFLCRGAPHRERSLERLLHDYCILVLPGIGPSRRDLAEVDPIVWTKFCSVVRWCGGLTKTAARKRPSIPGLSQRSDRIPA
jgi:hypothetical protein